eukprot:2325396-Amphidinium_carterae.1
MAAALLHHFATAGALAVHGKGRARKLNAQSCTAALSVVALTLYDNSKSHLHSRKWFCDGLSCYSFILFVR